MNLSFSFLFLACAGNLLFAAEKAPRELGSQELLNQRLELAVKESDAKSVHELLAQKADPNCWVETSGFDNKIKKLPILSKVIGKSINTFKQSDKDNIIAIIQELLQAKANPNVVDDNKFTALIYSIGAFARNCKIAGEFHSDAFGFQAFKLLLDHNADISKATITTQNKPQTVCSMIDGKWKNNPEIEKIFFSILDEHREKLYKADLQHHLQIIDGPLAHIFPPPLMRLISYYAVDYPLENERPRLIEQPKKKSESDPSNDTIESTNQTEE